MNRCIAFSIALSALVLVTRSALAGGDFRSGTTVVVFVEGQLTAKDGRIGDRIQPGEMCDVKSVDRDRLDMVCGDKHGWLEKSKVAPLDRDAIVRLTEMINAQPKNGRLYNARACAWEDLREPDKAIADYGRVIELEPKNARAYCSRGELRTDHDRAHALADFNEALRIDPKFVQAYLGRATLQFKAKEFDEAIADSDRAIKIDARRAGAYGLRGYVRFWGKADIEGAIADGEKATQLDSNCTIAYQVRAFAALPSDPDRALEIMGDLIRIKPSATAYADRAVMRIPRKEWELAIADCNEAIRLDPKYALGWIRRGTVRMLKEQYDDAIADLSEAVRLDRNNREPFGARAFAWFAKRDLDRALADLNEAVRLDPEAASVRHNRGRVWFCKGVYDRASADYAEAIRLQPDLARTHLYRAFMRLLQRRHDAIDGFQAVVDLDEKPETSTGAIWGTVAARLLKDENAARRFLAKSPSKSDDDWPSPLFRFLRHEIDERQLLVLAAAGDNETEARYCAGMTKLAENRPAGAKAHFQWLHQHADAKSIYRDCAEGELKRLEQQGSKP
jgi:tetratricopeptide (TPR) repeat protein